MNAGAFNRPGSLCAIWRDLIVLAKKNHRLPDCQRELGWAVGLFRSYFNWKWSLFCFAGSTVLLEGSGHSAQTQTPPREAAFGIKWACLSPQTAANVRAWENNELFQEIYLFSFLTPKLILRNEICVCFSLGMFEFTSPKSWGTRSGRRCLRLHMRWINLLFTSLLTSFQKRRELTTTKNH